VVQLICEFRTVICRQRWAGDVSAGGRRARPPSHTACRRSGRSNAHPVLVSEAASCPTRCGHAENAVTGTGALPLRSVACVGYWVTPYLGPRDGGVKGLLARNPLTRLAELLQTNNGKINSSTAAARLQAGDATLSQFRPGNQPDGNFGTVMTFRGRPIIGQSSVLKLDSSRCLGQFGLNRHKKTCAQHLSSNRERKSPLSGILDCEVSSISVPLSRKPDHSLWLPGSTALIQVNTGIVTDGP
jgi:hypothetical protein